MNLKILTQLSHFITLLFGISFGMTMAIYIEHSVNNAIIAISTLTYSIILIMFLAIALRIVSIYLWKKNKIWHSFTVQATLNSSEIKSYSETEFITEHYWGYAKVTDSKTNEYEVTHPKWKQYLITHSEINVDFGAVYGTDFEFINRIKPNSVMLIEGSEITVENKTKIGTQNKA